MSQEIDARGSHVATEVVALNGEILEVVQMGDLASGLSCYYRQTKPLYHTIIPLTDFVAFTEVTPGPFDPSGTVLADWAPAEGPDGKLRAYINDLQEQTANGANGR